MTNFSLTTKKNKNLPFALMKKSKQAYYGKYFETN